jgi:hypothetical protein
LLLETIRGLIAAWLVVLGPIARMLGSVLR